MGIAYLLLIMEHMPPTCLCVELSEGSENVHFASWERSGLLLQVWSGVWLQHKVGQWQDRGP